MTASASLPLVIGCCEPSSKLAMSVLDGTLPLPGCSTRFVRLGPGEMLLRAFADPELNVAELSLSNYVSRVAAGDCPYVMLPVYTARAFPQGWFFARSDRGIQSLADLRGRRVGMSAWPRTLNVWARGFLADEYRIQPAEVRWVIRDMPEVIASFRPPVPVEVPDTDKTLSALLEAGEIDALMALHAPECYLRGTVPIQRLPAHPEQAAAEYFQRRQVFPILHVMGVRRQLLEQRPELARDLHQAFAQALQRSGQHQGTAMADRAFRYGVGAPELKTLERFLEYHYSQGLSQRRLGVDELFAPMSIARYQH